MSKAFSVSKESIDPELRTLAKDGFDTLILVVLVSIFQSDRMSDPEPEKCCAYPGKGV